jgi:hypothetical protein
MDDHVTSGDLPEVLITPPRRRFRPMKITFTPGSEPRQDLCEFAVGRSSVVAGQNLDREPGLDGSPRSATNSIVARSLKIGTRTLKLARDGMRCPYDSIAKSCCSPVYGES